MARVRRNYEPPAPHAQQMVLAHHPQHAFMVDREIALLPFPRDAAIAIGR